MKKIFFNYSDQADDIVMTNNLCLHFAVLKDKVSIWHKGKILPGEEIKKALENNLDNSNAAVHLLSIAYETEKDCIDILQRSIRQNKKNIPVLLSSFDWESDDTLVGLKEEILPHNHKPVDVHPNYNAVYTEIVQSVKKELFGDDGKVRFNERRYYYILAGSVLAAGVFISYQANNRFDSLAITLLVFFMFVITSLFVLRKIIFPASVSTSKF